jgi:tetratricopeptide (TPR) repeat protein
VEAKVPEVPRLPIEDMLDKDLSDKELLKEIDRLLGVAHKNGVTYFELLGVKEDTSQEQLKKIYFKFAKKFHPDAKPELFQGPVRDKVEDLFAKITEAKETLSNPVLREQYLKKLKSQVSDKDMEMGQRAMEAEMEFEKAGILMKKNQWEQAREKLERAVSLYPDEPEYKMHLAWVNYKIKGPAEVMNAKRIIKEVLAKRPQAIDGYYFLAMIEKAEGDLDQAEQNLEKVLAKRPHDIDIKRELQLLSRKKTAAPPKKKGGLFGKK